MENEQRLRDLLFDLVSLRRGHFQYESGHHGEIWLELDGLLLDPGRLEPLKKALAQKLANYEFDAVVGPLTGGAFLAQMVAAELGVFFCYTEPAPSSGRQVMFAVSYRLPSKMAPALENLRIALVDDVINAGSATRATFTALVEAGAKPVAIGALMVLGNAVDSFVSDHDLDLVSLTRLSHDLWEPAGCPLCRSQRPLENSSAGPKGG